jgi:hypothetical protein
MPNQFKHKVTRFLVAAVQQQDSGTVSHEIASGVSSLLTFGMLFH